MMKFCFTAMITLFFSNMLMAQTEAKPHPIDVQLNACLDKDENQTTVGMMECEGEAQKAWDKALNKNYKELMGMLKGEEKTKLKKTQRLWIQFRDAEFDFSGTMHYNMQGSMYRLFAAGRQTEVVKTRALELQQYVETLTMR